MDEAELEASIEAPTNDDESSPSVQGPANPHERTNRDEAEGADVRFHWTPVKGWDKFARGMKVRARNVLNWKGWGPIPEPELVAGGQGPWLLPTSDATAVQIAKRQDELRSAGWRLLTCDPEVVLSLGNKSRLRSYAETLGLTHCLPTFFTSKEEATYPCILKSSSGEFGKDCFIIKSREELDCRMPNDIDFEKWVLQELVYGSTEYSVTLLAVKGKLLNVLGSKYEYASDCYVYPYVKKVGKEPFDVPPEHLEVMQTFLSEYTGLCNFNYKVRMGEREGTIAIFEVNTRIGGDLSCDVPRDLARTAFQQMEELSDSDL